MSVNKIAYVELPATSTAAMKTFYGELFGWSFEDWGDGYAAFSDAGLEGGFNAESEHRTKAPLMVIETDDIEAMEAAAVARGGVITLVTFSFPGGRRFHFSDPAGNELAVMQAG